MSGSTIGGGVGAIIGAYIGSFTGATAQGAYCGFQIGSLQEPDLPKRQFGRAVVEQAESENE